MKRYETLPNTIIQTDASLEASMKTHTDAELEDLLDDFTLDGNIDSRYYRAACREYDQR